MEMLICLVIGLSCVAVFQNALMLRSQEKIYQQLSEKGSKRRGNDRECRSDRSDEKVVTRD